MDHVILLQHLIEKQQLIFDICKVSQSHGRPAVDAKVARHRAAETRRRVNEVVSERTRKDAWIDLLGVYLSAPRLVHNDSAIYHEGETRNSGRSTYLLNYELHRRCRRFSKIDLWISLQSLLKQAPGVRSPEDGRKAWICVFSTTREPEAFIERWSHGVQP